MQRNRNTLMRALGAVLLAFALGACTPQQAIAFAFGRHGPAVVDQAEQVAWCESRHDPDATNGQYLGLFQLGRYHYWRLDGRPWNDPLANAQAAESLYAEQGWRPWSCRP